MLHYYSVLINKEGKFYVAHCPELDVTSQGENLEEAENNLREAIELYIESFGTDDVAHRQPPLITSIAIDVPNHA
jgi:predicted RNase H-like HicB family nuclease